MTRGALVIVPLVVLLVVSALVVPGCSSNDAVAVVVRGLFDAYPGPLTLTGGEVLLADAKLGDGSDEQMILEDATMEFDGDYVLTGGKQDDGGRCTFEAIWWPEGTEPFSAGAKDIHFNLEGEWEQDGNLVTASLSEVDNSAVKEAYAQADINLAFVSAESATGTMVLEHDGDTYEGGIAIIKSETPHP